MRIADVPHCCTAKMIIEFGTWYFDLDAHITEIDTMCKTIKAEGNACVIACTTSAQKVTNKALRKCGFTRSRWMSKKRHPETKLAVWTKVLEE